MPDTTNNATPPPAAISRKPQRHPSIKGCYADKPRIYRPRTYSPELLKLYLSYPFRWHHMRKVSQELRPDGSLQEIYESNLYHVMVIHDTAGNVGQIRIRRHDWGPLVDWRDKQDIKNQIAGPEAEAIELYPSESRLYDVSNFTHLWLNPKGAPFPVGYKTGNRNYSPSRGQRPQGQRTDTSPLVKVSNK